MSDHRNLYQLVVQQASMDSIQVEYERTYHEEKKVAVLLAVAMLPLALERAGVFLFLARKYKSDCCSKEEWNHLVQSTRDVYEGNWDARKHLTRGVNLVEFVEVFPELTYWTPKGLPRIFEDCFGNSHFTVEKLKSLANGMVNNVDEFTLWPGAPQPDRFDLNEEIMDSVAIVLTKINSFKFEWSGGMTLQAWNKLIRMIFFSSSSSSSSSSSTTPTTTIKKLKWEVTGSRRFYLRPPLEYTQMIHEVLGGSPASSAATRNDFITCPIEDMYLEIWNDENGPIRCDHRFVVEENLVPIFTMLQYMKCLKTLKIQLSYHYSINWTCLAQVITQGRQLETMAINFDNDEKPPRSESPFDRVWKRVLPNDSILSIVEAAGKSPSLKKLIMFLGDATLLEDITPVHERICSILQKENTTLTKVLIQSNRCIGEPESHNSNTIEFLCQYNRLGRNKIIKTLHEFIDLLANVKVVEDREFPFMRYDDVEDDDEEGEYRSKEVPKMTDTEKSNIELSIIFSMLQGSVALWIPKAATVAGNKRKRSSCK